MAIRKIENKPNGMSIIAVYGGKGGVGKTTTATNLAGAYADTGARVALVDVDPQRSCIDICDKVEKFDVLTVVPRSGYDFVIIDHPPSHIDAPIGDIVIMPTQVGEGDLKSFQRARHLFKGKSFLMVVTLVDYRVRDDKIIAESLKKKMGALIVKRRNLYRRVTRAHTSVFEFGNRFRASEAIKEHIAIMDRVNEMLASKKAA